MKKNLLTVFTAFLIVAFSVISFGQETRQTNSKYVISAEAGGVNFVQGNVAIARKVGRSGLLLKGDSVNIGDKVSTEAEGKAEILLNPGSYIRLGGNSSFEFVDTSLENLLIRLNRGSAIFEVITTDGFTFAVNTAKASFNVVESGVYRIDVLEDGNAKIEVWKGKAQIGDDEGAEIKKGRTATTGGNDIAIAKFDRGERDSLENWSLQRAKELAKANDRLDRNLLRNTLITGFNSRGWNFYDSFGLWVYDPFWGSYCFLPFGNGWSSPYGFGFGRDIWHYRLPYYFYNQPPPRVNVNSGPNETAGTSAPVRNPRKVDSADSVPPRVTPPFQKVDQEIGRGRMNDEKNDYPGNFPGRSTSPSIFPPPSSSSPSAPTRSDDNEPQPIRGKEKP